MECWQTHVPGYSSELQITNVKNRLYDDLGTYFHQVKRFRWLNECLNVLGYVPYVFLEVSFPEAGLLKDAVAIFSDL